MENEKGMMGTLSFGELLKSARLARGLTMAWVASRSGRNQSYLSHIERGQAVPTEEFLRSVASYYGCPWWGERRNKIWLQSVAQIYITSGSQGLGRQDSLVRSALSAGHQIVETLDRAIFQEPDLRTILDNLGERLYLPGIKKLSVKETLPMWSWIRGTLDVDIYGKNSGTSVVETADAILAYVDVTLRDVTVDIDSAVLGRRIREIRESKGWSPESLTRAVNEIRRLQERPVWPVLETADIVEIERGADPLSLAAVEALAQALDVTPSALLSTTTPGASVSEDEIIEMLRDYGLSEEAVASLQGLLAYWRAREMGDL